MPKVKIDGVELEVPAGITVLPESIDAGLSALSQQHQHEAAQDHRHGQDLAHGHPVEQDETLVGVGLAEEFHHEAGGGYVGSAGFAGAADAGGERRDRLAIGGAAGLIRGAGGAEQCDLVRAEQLVDIHAAGLCG